MYGMVNKAVRGLIISQYDEATWERIANKAGVDEDFIGMHSYSDQVTFDLVNAASEELGASPEALLELFGKYWIKYTADEGYGPLVNLFGSSLEEFLVHLGDDLHARVSLTMPNLRPPEFKTEVLGEGLYRIHYHSERQGLTSMVQGLLEGLGERYNRKVSVQHIETICQQPTHELFEVQIEE